VWGTLLVGILVATIANLNTTTTDTPLAKLFIVHVVQTYPLLVWSSLSLLLTLTLLSWFGSRDKQTISAFPRSARDRTHILRRLRVRYEQVLAQSLQGVVQVELELASRPAAVQNALSLSLRLPDQPDQLLPPHTSIVQAYELAQQELLILGEPGAGKSTLLVELAHCLLEQAEQDETRPLPILLPLSTWAVRRPPLDEWLSEELARLYDMPPRLSKQYIQAGQVLLLLDGLDEMEEAARPGCVTAINVYHREHLQSLVVCSRTNEYEVAATRERLALHTAVLVQPLSREQVDTYLTSMGKPLAALRATLRKNVVLRELATTPLMLQVLILTYYGTSVRELSHKEAQLREQIWADYVQRMVSRKGDMKRYSLPITINWLSFLARQMRQRNQTIFYLEQLQPDWLPKRQRAFYRWSTGLLVVLVFVLACGLTSGLVGDLTSGLLGGLFFGLIFGLFAGLEFALSTKIAPTEVLTWSGQRLLWVDVLFSGLFPGLLGGLFFGLTFGLFAGLAGALVCGLAGGLFFTLRSELSQGQLTERLMLSPNEGIRRSIKNGLLIGLLSGLLFGVAMLPVSLGRQDINIEPRIEMSIELGFAMCFVLMFMMIRGLGAAVQHYVLRFWLARSSIFPWRAIPFLEDATARILLQRVDGGYSFIHHLLLDYCADLDAQTPLVQEEAMQTKSTPVQTKASTRADKSCK
jgi:hypothetical protein